MFNANRLVAHTTSGLIWSLSVSPIKREVAGATVLGDFVLSVVK
jgi:hypothetical protein